MKLQITGKNINIGKALPTYITGGLDVIVQKYFNRATDARVVMEKNGDTFTADIHVHVNKYVDVDATGEAGDAYSAFEQALDHAAKRLRRKKRMVTVKHRNNKCGESLQLL